MNLIKIIVLSLLSLILLLENPSISSACILALAYLIIATIKLIQVRKKKTIILLWGIPIIFVALFIIFYIGIPSGIRVNTNRIIASYNPEVDPNGLGWQGMEQKAIMDSSNLFGETDYNGTSLEMFNRDAYNFTFIVVLANYGWVLSIVMVMIILAFNIKLIIDSGKIKDTYGKFLMIGIACLFILRNTFCLLMNLNLGIKANFDIPFISYEKIGFIVDSICLAIVFSIYRKKDIISSFGKERVNNLEVSD